MGANTKIEWCDFTFNPWVGCSKVSPGCAHCYAETLMDTRYGRVRWGKGQPRSRTSHTNWKQPLRWNRDAQRALLDAAAKPGYELIAPGRPRVFCASLADWLDDEVPIEWLADLLDLIRRTPNLDWLLLTKRPQNWRARIEAIKTSNLDLAAWLLAWLLGPGEFGTGPFDGLKSPGAPANVWLGTTVEDQQRADERIPELLKIPARVRFLSCEPLLGPVDLTSVKQTVAPGYFGDCLQWYHRGYRQDEEVDYPTINWVICGGESGPGARPMHPNWARSLRDQCEAAGVPYLFKQWGEHAPHPVMNAVGDHSPKGGEPIMVKVGKKAAGRLLDGREHNEFPEVRA